jgi:hypothetical protein
MTNFDSTESALVVGMLILLTLLAIRLRPRFAQRRAAPARDTLDTVAGWPPESARVLSIHERQAYELLRRALPGMLVLAQVPLARFLRVPTRHSYNDWLQRVGSLSADLLLCDTGSRVLAVIDIRSPQETERSRRRHERLGRVLKAAGIRVFTWREGELPSLAEVRHSLAHELMPVADAPVRTTSRPLPLIPVAEIEEMLAPGDEANYDTALEPVPSAFLDDVESVRGQLART